MVMLVVRGGWVGGWVREGGRQAGGFGRSCLPFPSTAVHVFRIYSMVVIVCFFG